MVFDTKAASGGTIAESNALLLDSTYSIRFVPDQENPDSASITFYAWDLDSNSSEDLVDVSTRGDTTPYSSDAATRTITVTDVNDAPTFVSIASNVDYTEGDETTSLGTITINDVDIDDVVTVSVTLAEVNWPADATAPSNVNDTYGGIPENDTSWNATGNLWTTTGTVAEVNAALADLLSKPSATSHDDGVLILI